jgi:crotonobetainyl-CoA:carnitine CoA-transferase CaiB-like acyl-CoA transferase
MGIPKQIEHATMGTTNLVGSPINLSDTPAKFFRPAPLLGEHTEEILKRLGYDSDRIESFRANGVI